jgi:hypothetical protein
MSLLSDDERRSVAGLLAPMTRPVRLVFATQTFGCETCADARRILDELPALQPLVSLEEVNLVLERARAERYGLDAAPATAVVAVNPDGSEWDPGVRFYGMTSGYEFSSLLEAILLVSSGDSGLSPASRALAAAVTEPTRLQVFVTPT